MIRTLFLIAALVVLPLFLDAQTVNYKTYSNARFHYSIQYPADLLEPQGEAENGDGQAFRAGDGRAELRVWGAHNATGQTLRKAFDDAVKEFGPQATYKAMKPSWFVVTAVVGNKILYRKTVLRRGVFKTFELNYDSAQRATFDPVAARISKSFVG